MAWVGYELGMTPSRSVKLTPMELIDLFNGYLWRMQQQENMIAALVSCYIANYAGKALKKGKQLTIKDIFTDGRFTKLTEEDRAIIEELNNG